MAGEVQPRLGSHAGPGLACAERKEDWARYINKLKKRSAISHNTGTYYLHTARIVPTVTHTLAKNKYPKRFIAADTRPVCPSQRLHLPARTAWGASGSCVVASVTGTTAGYAFAHAVVGRTRCGCNHDRRSGPGHCSSSQLVTDDRGSCLGSPHVAGEVSLVRRPDICVTSGV